MSNIGIGNVKDISIEDLSKTKIYSQKVIEAVQRQDYLSLKNLLSYEDRENKDVMMPILYAVKNKFNTYLVFKILGRNLQSNTSLAFEVIRKEPELIKHTPLCEDKDFILDSASINPEVLKYMSPELEKDDNFVISLYKKNNEEITRYLSQNHSIETLIMQDKSLLNDKVFMQVAIISNAEILKYVSDDLKNNKLFIEVACRNNYDVIEYIVNNTKEFEKEGLEVAKDVLIDISATSAIKDFSDESKKIKGLIENKSNNLDEVSNKDSVNFEDLLKRDKQLQRHIKLFERIQNGEVDSVRAARLINSVCKNISPEYKKKILSILKLDEEILRKEEKSKEGFREVKLEEIKDATSGLRLSQVEKATKDTKKRLIENIEKENEFGRTSQDIGEK